MGTSAPKNTLAMASEIGRAQKAKLHKMRIALAKGHGLSPNDFSTSQILATMAEHKIPASAIHPKLIEYAQRQAGLKARKAARHGLPNGGNGQSFPLDAIPERPAKANGARKPWGANRGINAGNPNQPTINRILDLIDKGKQKEAVMLRLLAVVEKLVG